MVEGEDACLGCDVIDSGLDVGCQRRGQGGIYLRGLRSL